MQRVSAPSSAKDLFGAPWHQNKNIPPPVTFRGAISNVEMVPPPVSESMNAYISTGHDRGTSEYGNRVAIVCAENVSSAYKSLNKELEYIGCLNSNIHDYVLARIPRNSAAFAKIVNIDEIPHQCTMDVSCGYRRREFGDRALYHIFYSEFHGGERVSDVHKYAYVVARDVEMARMLLDEVLKANNLPTFSSVPYTLNNLTLDEIPRCAILHKTRCKKPVLIRD